jgi:hypothetical protein
VRIVSD